MTDSETHDAVLAAVAERLATHPATAHMLGGRAGTAPATDGPAVTLSRGKFWAKPDGAAGKLHSRQVDVRARLSAPHQEQLPALCVAVQTALCSLQPFGPVQQCVLLGTGRFEEEGDLHARRDLFACFV